jgi:hypothetical protein
LRIEGDIAQKANAASRPHPSRQLNIGKEAIVGACRMTIATEQRLPRIRPETEPVAEWWKHSINPGRIYVIESGCEQPDTLRVGYVMLYFHTADVIFKVRHPASFWPSPLGITRYIFSPFCHGRPAISKGFLADIVMVENGN